MTSNTIVYQKLFAAVTSKDKLKLAGLPKQITTSDARNLFLTAANKGHVAVLTYLHDVHGFTTKSARVRNNYALSKAAENGHVEVLKCLHDVFGLTADDARADNNSALYMAAARGHLGVLKYLHDVFGLTADDARTWNNYALKWAAINGHVAVLECLRNTFGLTIQDARADNNDALRKAAENGHVEVLTYLHDVFGLTDDDARSSNNYALYIAAKNGDVATVVYLRETFGLTASDADQCDALSIADNRGNLDVMRELRDNWRPDPLSAFEREETRARASITDLAHVETPDFYSGLEFSPSEDSDFEATCGICMGATLHVSDAVLFSGKEHVLEVTGCGHVFHARCVEAMRTTATSCPMCRGQNMAAPGNVLVLVPDQGEPPDAFIARVRPEITERRRLPHRDLRGTSAC